MGGQSWEPYQGVQIRSACAGYKWEVQKHYGGGFNLQWVGSENTHRLVQWDIGPCKWLSAL